MNSIDFLKQCWQYYLMLEADFSALQRYITFEEDNFLTYSLELNKQYLSICSEIDVICKQYCNHLDSDKEVNKIENYAQIILQHNTGIVTSKITLKENLSLELLPWGDWHLKSVDSTTSYQSPKWWKLYNKVKHQRLDVNPEQFGTALYYKSANLQNVMNAIAGLFVLEMYFYKSLVLQEGAHSITTPSKDSNLFSFNDWEPQLINAGNDIMLEIV